MKKEIIEITYYVTNVKQKMNKESVNM